MTTSAQHVPAPVGKMSFRWRRRLSLAQDTILACFFAYTALLHGAALVEHGLDRLPSLFYGLEQALLFGIWIARRRSYATTPRPFDWVVAALGGWLMFAVRPADAPGPAFFAVGTAIQCAGLVLTIVAIGYLGKSFGIVAANRGLKINGPYRIVRHPVYFAHAVSAIGFAIASPTPWNLGIIATVFFFQILRIQSEERWLRQTAEYDAYAAKVRYRLIPGIY